MKNMILAIALTAMTSTAAAEGTKFICKEKVDFHKRSVIVTQVSNESMKEMKKYDFLVEVFDSRNKTPLFSKKVQAETEDVYFMAESKDKKVRFHIYLDEMEESSLTLNGEHIKLNCF